MSSYQRKLNLIIRVATKNVPGDLTLERMDLEIKAATKMLEQLGVYP